MPASHVSLYNAFSWERSPGFDTILKVVAAVGLRLHAEGPQQPPAPRSHIHSGERRGNRRVASRYMHTTKAF